MAKEHSARGADPAVKDVGKVSDKGAAKATGLAAGGEQEASALIDQRIAELGDWRGDILAWVRGLVRRALPDAVEEWKWRGVPVWSQDGMVCTGETYKGAVKLTFAKGALLPDPRRLFNSSLEGNTRRAIDIHEGERPDETALIELLKAAAALNAKKGRGTKG
jgi:hypothetical protein